MTIPIYKPYLPASSLKYAHDALNSTWISSQGKYIAMIQEKLQELLKVKYVLPLNNGTSACHLMAKALYRKLGPGECNTEGKQTIICSDNSYVASWNSFLFDNNFEILALAANIDTWNVDVSKLVTALQLNPGASVLITPNIGNIINVPELQRKFPNTLFVEDNCEGFLGKYEGVYSGTKSLCSAISFFGNKSVTCGEGGGLITDNEDVYQYCKLVQGQGQSSRRFVHTELGTNYRMTNIQAAILFGQLELLNDIMDMKSEVFAQYRNAFENREDVFLQSIEFDTKHSNWMFGIRIPNNHGYDEAEQYFKNIGIEIRPMFYPITAHSHLNNNVNIIIDDCTNAQLLNQQCIILPSFPTLTKDEQIYIIKSVNEYIMSL